MKCEFCGDDCVQPLYPSLNEKCYNINNCSNEICFCDVLCARLYDFIISPINVNLYAYNKLYNQNLLPKFARAAYEKMYEFGLFKLLPMCDISSAGLNKEDIVNKNYRSRILLKDYYRKQLGI